jgi:glyoxylase-like metal-dependent hydrolase (beta-lactamase superfamily II)
MNPLADLGVGPEVTPGIPVQLWPGVRRLTAPNPGLMTGPGTNTYLVGRSEVAVVDPGPDDPDHVAAVARAVAIDGGTVRWVLVTHTHADHAPGAAALARLTGAEVIGFDGRDGFSPDTTVGDGWSLRHGDLALRAVHTPGHASNHLCWLVEPHAVLLSGDHVMHGSTVVIRPPDGDMTRYLQSLCLLLDLTPAIAAIAPGHGKVIGAPTACVEGLVAHRLQREATVRDALGQRERWTVDDLLPIVYADVDDAHRRVGRDSLWAHLRKLVGDGAAVRSEPAPGGRACAPRDVPNAGAPEHPDLRAEWALSTRLTGLNSTDPG